MSGLFRRFLASRLAYRLTLMTAIAIVAVAGYSLIKEINKRAKLASQIKSLQSDIAYVEYRNKDLSDVVKYLESDAFKERQARLLLNMQKPDEKAVQLAGRPEASPIAVPKANGNLLDVILQPPVPQIDTARSKPSNALPTKLDSWWKYFFNN